MKEIDKTLLDSKEVSEYLSVPLRTLQKLAQEGRIKAIKVGKQWRYRKSDIERYFSFGTDFSREPSRIPNNVTSSPKEESGFIGHSERSDRRSYPRINTNFKCQYSINLPPFKVINNEGIVKNLSAGGILLVQQNNEIDEVEINDPIDLDFNFMAKEKTVNIKAEGKIVRKDSNRLGIMFRNINDKDKDIIIQYTG